MTGGVLDGRHRDRHVDEPAVLGAADGLEMVDTLAAPDAREHAVLLLAPILRNDERDVPADGLGRRPAEGALGGGVPEVMIPSRVLLTMTSSDDSTMAASRSPG